ncbi:hypothetical protein ACFCXS_02495 [Streptomyces sp. NPDC056373]|uniref:hypothetical protein n=1 Tax=Streptomyces sp. NPDC056373 TaxID=3345798 RepID=UPI0035D87DA1
MRRTRQAIAMDMARAEIERRRPAWASDEIQVSPVPWADDREWLAVHFSAAGWAVGLLVEVHCSGHARLHFTAPIVGRGGGGGGAVQESRRVASVQAVGALLDEAVARAGRVGLQPAQLIARTCTTGWLDWIHGELWLLPDHLVRVRGGVPTTMMVGLVGPELATPDTFQTLAFDPGTIRSAHRTNKVLPLAEITYARIHGGLTTSGMTLTMADGTRHKLLWMSMEPARGLLRDRLVPLLGPRLTH